MNGIVEGGWPFVWAAYIVSALVLGGYALRTLLQERETRLRAQHRRR